MATAHDYQSLQRAIRRELDHGEIPADLVARVCRETGADPRNVRIELFSQLRYDEEFRHRRPVWSR